ncbi:MAG: electron transfer flavoprotein subunit alpha [Verrucomicrobia bacterium]|nr:MAG: electron transfer flavoprotein subunit alpha [Verrucomicrobiota bacterium]
MSILVVAEHDGAHARPGSSSALAVARDLAAHSGERVELLVIGRGLAFVAADAARFAPVIVADHPLLANPTADRYAHIIADVAKAREAGSIVANSTTFAKDILPRASAMLSAAMAGDVTGYSFANGKLLLRRPMYAGAAMATVALTGRPLVITVRASAFPAAEPLAEPGERIVWSVDASTLPNHSEYVGLESRPTLRPELTEARVVVSGGRPFRTGEEFEKYVGCLADALNGATGCTRALVDAGIAPNEWQVGQTGKVVAPQLYVALGISGAVQHLAGMKNSRVVVAVNTDPEAPMFSVATYGLVGDVRQIVPELIRELGK